MQRDAPPSTRRARLRRARRADTPTLLECVGGPPAGRARALRRLEKALAADVYVIDEGGRLAGAVAVIYRRSLAEGGLVATVDWLALLGDDAAAATHIAELVDCALSRARRRGCVAIDAAPSDPRVLDAFQARGFLVSRPQIRASLRDSQIGLPVASEPRE
jgi:hypothetical protein